MSTAKDDLTQLEQDAERRGARRKCLGVAITIAVAVLVCFNLWLTTATTSTDSAIRWPWYLPLNNLGDWLAGVAGGLALVWLVLGYFQQSDELYLQRRQLEFQRAEFKLARAEYKRLADETSKQAKSVAANEQHARRDTFMRFHDLVVIQLAQHARSIGLAMKSDHGEAIRRSGQVVSSMRIDSSTDDWVAELNRVFRNFQASSEANEVAEVLCDWVAANRHVHRDMENFIRLVRKTQREAAEIGFADVFRDTLYVQVSQYFIESGLAARMELE